MLGYGVCCGVKDPLSQVVHLGVVQSLTEIAFYAREYFGCGYAYLDWIAGSVADIWIKVAAAAARMNAVRIFVVWCGIFLKISVEILNSGG